MDSQPAKYIVASVAIIIISVLFYFFVIMPAVNDIMLWWNTGNGLWFVIGLFIGLVMAFIASVYLASR